MCYAEAIFGGHMTPSCMLDSIIYFYLTPTDSINIQILSLDCVYYMGTIPIVIQTGTW